jgi:hypothetical protein
MALPLRSELESDVGDERDHGGDEQARDVGDDLSDAVELLARVGELVWCGGAEGLLGPVEILTSGRLRSFHGSTRGKAAL